MQFNKKYAIRKLAIGVASVALGFTTVGISPQIVLANEVEHFGRTNSGDVDTTGNTNLPKPTAEIKSVPNGEKNFYSTVAFTTEAGLGSGTLINEDTIVTVAHNFVHLNTKNNPITVENNVNKSGDIHIATLPNGKQVKFSNNDVKYWNREGYVQGFKNDLAVVKLRNKFTGETGATLHNEAEKLNNGDKIHVFGFPKGKLIPILNGTVENVENYGANIMGIAYQGSAPGMSGGGLYNANGELIGVNQNGVEGLRSGGITFSKEQLDWINSIVRGENTKPVYLQDEPTIDDKDNNKNDETVNLHYYIDYYIPSSLDEWRNGANISSKLIKSVEYNRPTKWTKGEDLTNGLYDGVEKTVEYNGIKYVSVGLESTRHITNETTNNTDTKQDYDKNNSNWRVGTEPVFKPTVAEEGGVYRLPVFLEPQVGWITQKFYNEEYNHQTRPNLNAEERYKLKDDVVSPYHNIDDKVEVPTAPKYIQKSNRIYKLVSNDPIPTKYEIANNSVSYFYKNLNLQSTEKTVETKPVVKYEADDSRERETENIRLEGKAKITQIITNPKVNDDGELGEETFEEIVQDSIDTIVKIGTKPKVQYNTKGKNVIKTTTTYTVNEKTGEVTEHKTSEVVDTLEGLMPPTIDKDEYNGNISTNTPIDEDGNLVLPPVVEIPEYKGTLSTNTPIDANGDLILPPVVDVPEHKEPSNNTQPINDNNQKPNKLEEPQNIQQPNNDNTNNTSEVKDNKVSQKQALPKTNALHNTSYILGLLLSTIGLKRNKKD